jgi:hypothetical protein
MLVASAELEVASVKSEGAYAEDCLDEDYIGARKVEHPVPSALGKKNQKKALASHEALTVALLRCLPDLLKTFKSETPVMQSLSTLPQFFRK